jgi:DNA-binding transcriptional ArsR family regulator
MNMNKQAIYLNNIFASLADATRRDILGRLLDRREMTVTEVAEPYDQSQAAISKHLQYLERAKLISKRREGKAQVVSLSPPAFASATEYLEWYRQLWEQRLDALDELLKKE